MSNWLTRPGYIAILAFLAGGALAAAAVLIFTQCGGDGGDGAPARRTAVLGTSTPGSTTPGATIAPPATGTPAATPTPGSALDPDETLANYVRVELNAEYVGPCSAARTNGYCSSEYYRGEDLVTFGLGLTNSEFSLEAVLTRNEDGTWSVTSFGLPSGAVPLQLDAQAVVYGAGSCLNFREQPSIGAAVVTCQLDGTRARVDDGPVAADGVSWWHLEGLGWASAEFLGVAAP